MPDPTPQQFKNMMKDGIKRNTEGKKKREKAKRAGGVKHYGGIGIESEKKEVFCETCNERAFSFSRKIGQEFNVCGKCSGKCILRNVK